MTPNKIREAFLQYFEEKGHTRVPSASLVPSHDPTLLFTNAGMVPFKDVFLGRESRPYTAAVSCQKCVRAGGKHNDLEQVGFTARHHTFFEMLGNFSFGKYFKREAIFYAWEFSTKVLQLPREKLYVTVHTSDDEAEALWKEIAQIKDGHLFRFGDADNFWQMGETGPCGPCSELFFDRGVEHGCLKADCKMGCGCDRYLEFWNLVFMQYLREADGSLKPLPRPAVDTGAGLERLAMILIGAQSNYETDAFLPLLKAAKTLAPNTEPTSASLKVLADHARASVFLIADGVMPSNEGRGYVLRRIIRRAVRHLHLLEVQTTGLPLLAKVVIDEMKEVYPELLRSKDLILRCLQAEEEQFRVTLTRGLQLFQEALHTEKGTLPGSLVFTLYDTFGFPMDLTLLLAKEAGRDVDLEAFETHMKAQKDRSRVHWRGSGESAQEDRWFLTDLPETLFTGYEAHAETAQLLGLWVEGQARQEVGPQETFEAVFDKTPFYAEGGGQLSDQGSCLNEDALAHIEHVKEVSGIYVHKGQVITGTLKVQQPYKLEINTERREGLRAHHTATHLLHWALRALLGDHVKQAGSVVAPEFLRFDFTHFEALQSEHLRALEHLMNEKLRSNPLVQTALAPKEEALQKGAIAHFGDKYADIVRVLSIGDFSVELCGGTHVQSVSEIQIVKIESESSIAAGVRRIVARCGASALKWIDRQEEIITNLKEALGGGSLSDLEPRLAAHFSHEKEQKRTIESLTSRLVRMQVEGFLRDIKNHGSLRYLVKILPKNSQFHLKLFFEQLKPRTDVAILIGVENEKAFLAIQSQTPNINSHALIQTLAPLIDGRGGGKAHYASAGGKNVSRLQELATKAESLLFSFDIT